MAWPSTVATACLVLGASTFWATVVAANKVEKNSKAGILKRLIVGEVYSEPPLPEHQKLDMNSRILNANYTESCNEIATFAELTHDTQTHRLLIGTGLI